jgi:hypothetical protein
VNEQKLKICLTLNHLILYLWNIHSFPLILKSIYLWKNSLIHLKIWSLQFKLFFNSTWNITFLLYISPTNLQLHHFLVFKSHPLSTLFLFVHSLLLCKWVKLWGFHQEGISSNWEYFSSTALYLNFWFVNFHL